MRVLTVYAHPNRKSLCHAVEFDPVRIPVQKVHAGIASCDDLR
jgi:putative NADPH-quinone reductase